MRVRDEVAAAVAAAVLAGCGGTQMPVPVSGTETDLAQLAGEWVGEYSSVETGRSGSIVFHLIAGTDSAHGDVLMNPLGMVPQQPMDPTRAGPAPPPSTAQVLAISFVRIEGGRVSGRLAPYTDPACDCPAHTVFEGRLSGEGASRALEGTYTTRREGAATEQRGRWRVMRRGP